MITRLQEREIKAYFTHQPVELVYLFGSQATGKTTPLSDYDFAVLFKKNLEKGKRFDLRLKYMGDLGIILKSDEIEVLDLNSASLSFRYAAIAPRHDLYVADEKKRALFEAETTSLYFDEVYFLKQNTFYSLPSIAKTAV